MKRHVIAILLLILGVYANAQQESCNNLGVWLWHIEGTEYPTIVNLANDLSELGVKRVYVKVADGSVDSVFWTELVNRDFVDVLHQHDIEPWAWSYNYPGNEVNQAEALRVAAQTGYKGYILDLESEFDGDAINLLRIVKAFHDTRDSVLAEGIAQDSMPIYLSTWGNPDDHNFQVHVADPYVDGFMPQTYLENWGLSYLDDPAFWIGVGNEEYRALGATKPIHHIISMEHGNVTADHVNQFFAASGANSSIWRIPGSGTPLSIRQVWEEVDWEVDFCNTISTIDNPTATSMALYPNPVDDWLTIKYSTPEFSGIVTTITGVHLMQFQSTQGQVLLDFSNLQAGMYHIRLESGGGNMTKKVIKTQSK